jgi:DNA-binding ferritin-like protein
VVLPPDIPQFFAPTSGAGSPRYVPSLLAVADVRYEDAKNAVAQTMSLGFTVPLRDGAVTVDWDHAAPTTLSLDALKSEPDAGATFAELPAAAASRASYAGWEKEFARWLLASKPLALLRHSASGLTSKPGESESEFRARIQLAGREKRDAAKEALQQKYAPKLAQITEQIRRAEQAQGRESDQATQRKLDTALSVGATIVGALFGRKKLSMSTIGRATTAAKSASRISKEDEDVSRAGETVESRKAQLATLDQQLQTELAAIDTSSDAQTAPLESITVQPKKSGIAVRKVALLWSSA